MSRIDRWQTVRLGSVVAKLGSGATPRGGKGSYKDEGIALIRSMNVHDNRFVYDNLAYIDDQQASALSNVEVKSGDVLLNITGASVARCCSVPAEVLPARVNQHVAIIRPDPTHADSKYIEYLLTSPAGKQQLLGLAQGGATREALTKSTLENLRVELPPIDSQIRISHVLKRYDELIENNSRRIAILEEMAQAIYREWFVGFRYPGHEDVALVDSELGPIPEGWAVRELREVVRVNEHSLKAGAEIGEIQYVDIASVDVGRISKTQTIEYSEAPGRARRKGQHGDIIWSTVRPNRRAYAQLIDPPTNLVMSTGFAVISPVRLPSSLLKQMLSTDAFVGYLSSRATGATYPAVTPSVFEEARFVVADEATNSKFNELAEPIDTLIAFLKSEIEILTETRDMLLPKLISGEIDLSGLDIELADSSV
jgi:type I restriction enzyme S subunit